MTLRFVTLVASWLVWLPALPQTLPALEQNPASTRWYRLRTPHFRVLYTQGFEKTAQRTAQRLEQVYAPVSAGLQRQPRPIAVVLQNQTTVSNGFVSLLPRKTEFFTTPPQNQFVAGTLDWLDELSVHEFRHVVQREKALTGVSLLAYRLLSYPAIATIGIGIPDWFGEGDAVGTETVLTQGGRGRIPDFDLGFRANLLSGRRFDYSKSVGGSYRDNVPNHYPLGYLMTTYAKRNYGVDVFSDVLTRYYRFPFYPFSFSSALRKKTGLRVEELYRRTIDDVTDTYRQQQAGLKLTDAAPVPARAERQGNKLVFTNYRYPQWLDDTTLLAVKTGLGDIDQLVRLRRTAGADWREVPVYVRGFVNNPEMLSAAAGKACWIEVDFDPRWGQRIYSDIRLLDLPTGKLTRLTRRGRYTAAALSPDATKLIAVRNDEAYQTQLVVIDAQTGLEQTTLPNPDHRFYSQPRWSADGATVVAVALAATGKTIEQFDTRTGQHRDLLPVANENLSNAQPWGDFVLYNSPRSGIDNLYAVDTRTGRTRQVTSRPLGAYHAAPSPVGNTLAFHDFTVDGYRLATMPLDTANWLATAPATDDFRYFGPLLKQDPNARVVTASLPDSVPPAYRPERFRRLAHALNIYGYGLVLGGDGQATVSTQSLQVGVNSQDLLNTTQVQAGYNYNQSEQIGNLFANVSYQGLYPIIDVGVQRGTRQTSLLVSREGQPVFVGTDRWQYNQLSAGLRLPLNLTRSRYAQSALLSAYYGYQQVTDYELPVRVLTEVGTAGSIQFLTYGLSYARLLKQSLRDVGPRWGQTISATLRNTPFGGRLAAWQFGTSVSVYVPGLLKHQSLRLRGAYQQQWGRTDVRNVYQFASSIAYPRGAGYIAFDRIRFGAVEYRLPVISPHWTLGRFLYIQRVQAMGFSDYARGQSQFRQTTGLVTATRNVWTAGLDVSFVVNFLRLRTPFDVGVRTIRHISTGEWIVQPLVLGIGL
ncbi:MAG: hypothetical protein H7Z72_02655 [Bacteroidetes bacterium]|nr:hypothetical protein [Fibrella sp.]